MFAKTVRDTKVTKTRMNSFRINIRAGGVRIFLIDVQEQDTEEAKIVAVVTVTMVNLSKRAMFCRCMLCTK